MPEVRTVCFPNADGLALHGTLHLPERPRADAPAVVLMSPGVKMRVGPGRLYVPITELLNARGHAVLRFDFFGLGDSEGELAESQLADVYNHIEVGRYAADATAAIEWMKRELGHRRFIVGGLCGGAITALYAAKADPAVEALLSIGMTVTLASDAAQPAAHLSEDELRYRRKGYFKRLVNPVSWWRLLTGKSEFGVIWRSLMTGIRRRPAPAPIPEGSELTPEQLGNVNPMFPEAYFAFLSRGGRALMLFSEKDRLYAEYREKFVALHAPRLARHGAQVTEHLVPGANHVISRREWRAEMLAVTERWLDGLARA
jgi:predicted alpha/beta hydrolase